MQLYKSFPITDRRQTIQNFYKVQVNSEEKGNNHINIEE